jgi:hypothetical protein
VFGHQSGSPLYHATEAASWVFEHVRKEHSITVSPRTAVKALRMLQKTAEGTIEPTDLNRLNYLTGLASCYSLINKGVVYWTSDLKVATEVDRLQLEASELENRIMAAENVQQLEDLRESLKALQDEVGDLNIQVLVSFREGLKNTHDELFIRLPRVLAQRLRQFKPLSVDKELPVENETRTSHIQFLDGMIFVERTALTLEQVQILDELETTRLIEISEGDVSITGCIRIIFDPEPALTERLERLLG